MNALESSPFDVVAVDFLSFGFFTVVNNLWTWVAVVTAAVSFWKIRASAPSVLSVAEPCHDRNSKSKGFESISENGFLTESAAGHHNTVGQMEKTVPKPSAGLITVGHGDDRVNTKGKLTVYYCEESYASSCCSETTTSTKGMEQSEEVGCEFVLGLDGSIEWWERMLRFRRGGSSWYRCQDLTVLNGNVVRLWNENDDYEVYD